VEKKMNAATTIFDFIVDCAHVNPHIGNSVEWKEASFHFVSGDVIVKFDVFIAHKDLENIALWVGDIEVEIFVPFWSVGVLDELGFLALVAADC